MGTFKKGKLTDKYEITGGISSGLDLEAVKYGLLRLVCLETGGLL